MIRRRVIAFPVALICALGLVACGNDSKVGSDKLKNFESQGGEGALGGTTTTVAPAATTPVTAAPAATTATPKATAPPTTKAAPAATTTPPPTASITIKIQGDGQGNAFEPSNTRAFTGSTIRFENVDSVAHQVRGRNAEFQSPNLAPGATWDFKVSLAPGNYEYTDARPYAVGYLDVLSR